MATAGEGGQLRLAIRSAAAVGETFFGLLHVGRLVSTFMATGGIYMQTERRPQLCSRLPLPLPLPLPLSLPLLPHLLLPHHLQLHLPSTVL